jgi:hypothetical protein
MILEWFVSLPHPLQACLLLAGLSLSGMGIIFLLGVFVEAIAFVLRTDSLVTLQIIMLLIIFGVFWFICAYAF